MSSPTRRLAAILVTDIVGYSALASQDEDRALQLVHLFQSRARKIVGRHGGRVVKFLGDGLLGEFESVEGAVYAAHGLHAELTTRTEEAGLDRSEARSAIHLGELLAAADGDVYGEGVNLAARLEKLAEPGSIVVSEDVWRQLHQRPEFRFDPLGEHELKGIAIPVEVFRVALTKGWRPLPLARADRAHASIAILPFVAMGSDPEDDLFADGITEDVTAAVAKIRSLRVTSRTSSMRYKGSSQAAGEIARELGVATLLEGSIRRAGSRARIVVQLIDPEIDEHLWTETFDRNIEDLLDLQAEIAERVAEALRAALTPEEKRGIAAGRTRDWNAFELYLKGRTYLYKIWSALTTGEHSRALAESAIELFEVALGRDPGYARAHAGIALAYNEIAGIAPFDAAMEAGVAAARRAISLAPELSEGHGAMGALTATEMQYGRALEHLRRSVAIDPNDAYFIHELVWCAAQLGNLVEALRWARRAVEIEPHEGTHHAYVGRLLTDLGAFDEAEAWLETAIEVEPDNAWAYSFLATLQLLDGRPDRADETIATAFARHPGALLIDYTAAFLAVLKGDYTRALKHYRRYQKGLNEEFAPLVELGFVRAKLGETRILEEYLERAEERSRAHATHEGWWRHRYDLVAVHALRGERAEALRCLADSIDRGWLPFRRNRLDPFFESLAEDAEFQALFDKAEAQLDRMREQARAEGLVSFPG